MKINVFILSLLTVINLAGCSKAQQEGKVIAEVNGDKLTYEFLLDQFPGEYRNSVTDDQLARAVDTWIETELLYQEALKQNIDKDSRIKNIIEQKRKDIISARYIDLSLTANDSIAEGQIESVYNSKGDMFKAQENMFKLSHIVLSTKGGADAVYNRLVKGEDFETLAKDYSEDNQTRDNGGDLGLVNETGLEDNIKSAFKDIQDGQYTMPVKSLSGYYHIFRLQARIPAGTQIPLEYIKGEIKESINADRQQQEYNDLVAKLKEKADIKRYLTK